MAVRPVVSPITEEIYAALGPWARQDTADARWDLLTMIESFGVILQEIEDIIRDTDAGPGWSIVMDADRAPVGWIPWGMQFMGVRPRAGLSDAAQRARWKSTDGINRGKPSALVGAAQQYLTGAKTVYLVERHGSPYRLTVSTVAAETANPTAVLAALMEQKPAGIILVHSLITGANYNALRDTHSSYTAVKAKFATYTEVLSNPTKQ